MNYIKFNSAQVQSKIIVYNWNWMGPTPFTFVPISKNYARSTARISSCLKRWQLNATRFLYLLG